MVFGIFLTLFGIGALCVLLYNVAVYALPAFVGLYVGFGALHWGVGEFAAIVIGLFVGGAVFGLCQAAMTHTHRNSVRYLIVALFVAPAVAVGYSSGLQLSALGMSSTVGQYLFAVIGAISVGTTAFMRLATPSDQMVARSIS